MIKLFPLPLMNAFTLFVGLLAIGSSGLGQAVSDVPIDVHVPMHPTPVEANGKVHLVYELHLTNFKTPSLKLTDVEITDEDTNTKLLQYTAAELPSLMAHPGAPPDASRDSMI